MELVSIVVSASCTGGACPTIYELEDGDFAIQGYEMPNPPIDGGLPSGEAMVRLPRELMIRALESVPRER